LWTTIVVCPDHAFDRPLRGFHYSIGADIPGLAKVSACCSDTNMNVAGYLVDEEQLVRSVSWAIPALALGKFQVNGCDYTVKHTDVMELVSKTRLALCVHKAQDMPLTPQLLPLTQSPVLVEPDATGGYGAQYPLDSRAIRLGRFVAFWVELSFTGPLKIGGALPLIITLNGERSRSVS
jgi:hypothetical protein